MQMATFRHLAVVEFAAQVAIMLDTELVLLVHRSTIDPKDYWFSLSVKVIKILSFSQQSSRQRAEFIRRPHFIVQFRRVQFI